MLTHRIHSAEKFLMIVAATSWFCIGAVAQSYGQATPISNPLKSHDVKLNVSSGKLYNNGTEAKVLWTEEVQVKGALWVRLKFNQLILAGHPTGGESSTLKITSLADGKFQTLNAETAVQWRNTSAYFNGNAVRLELIAAPNGRLNMVSVDTAVAGEPEQSDINETICDDVDDRQLSNDPRNGRTAPGGCTGWLFDDRNNCMMTAGHCAPSTETMLFNVPLSDANGNRQFPGPEDQYAVDQTSLQSVSGGVGNDWCYFGCFPNANTGLTAFEAQGDSYELGTPAAVQPGDLIRITGYGSTSFPVNPMWNGAQKTQVGPYALFTSNELGYRTDTTGGNSGSPIIFEATGQAIGIHTHGGCGSGGGGTNFGTARIQSGLANALANPQGICILAIDFDFPNGLPETLATAGGTTVNVMIDDSDFDLEANTAILSVDTGSGFQAFSMTDLGDGLFQGTFPASSCGDVVRYFFSIESTDGELFTSPNNAPPNAYSAISANGVASVPFADDFESDMNWISSGDSSTGQWERGIPVGGGERGDPPTDADGTGSCYLTENQAGNSDVDGGTSILTSPIMDATVDANQMAVLSYYRWFDNGGSDDPFEVEISNDGGSNWTAVEDLDNGSGGWQLNIVSVGAVLSPTDQMMVRFNVSDFGGGSIVEAGVDGVKIEIIDCDDNPFLLGDVNQDGEVNLLDVQGFVNLLSNAGYQLEADINMDGFVNLLDVSLFVDLLSN